MPSIAPWRQKAINNPEGHTHETPRHHIRLRKSKNTGHLWSQVLNVPIGGDYGDNVVLLPTDSTPLVLFQKIADLPTQRNRVHADFSTRDLDGDGSTGCLRGKDR
ncbi:VOC family protein [Agrobacterium rosae]|uniref:VOC family protein n=1 Tax=Agrobacterium rosae TaxID=1972867 RepID=UPI00313F03C0